MHVSPTLLIVLDGATVRTETGCRHGVPWYVHHLGHALVGHVAADPSMALPAAMAAAIHAVNQEHPECDLAHPGSPSAAIAAIHRGPHETRWIVLGDVTALIETTESVNVIVDERVSATAQDARAVADRYAIGDDRKTAALLEMKAGELAARNRKGGYWIAATDPAASRHALTGVAPTKSTTRIALLSDGAARAFEFGLTSPQSAFRFLGGPAQPG